jgi:hypothetical protein
MAITAITRDFNNSPNIVRMEAANTLAQVATSGYLTAQADTLTALNSGTWEWLSSDMVLVFATDGMGLFTLSSDLTTLELYSTAGNGAVTLPVVAGNIPMFDGTLGAMEDSGIAATDILLTALADGHIFVGSAGGIATDVAMSGDATIANTGVLTITANAITTAKILNANVTLAKLAAGITPSHIVKFGGQHTTVGGSASEAITVTGALATDLAFVQVVDNGTNNVTVLQAAVTSNTLTITFSADPGADAIVNYQLLRAAT